MSENLALWEQIEKTPVAHTKPITGKTYQGTSPKPHYLIHKATETFGPCGIGWGFQIVDERIEDGAGGERMSIARVKVWYKWGGERGEVEHIGGTSFSGIRASGKPFTDEDAPKKSVTDALIKALSMIGFAGDIFMGRYDDSKYVSELREEAKAASEPYPKPTTKPQQADNEVIGYNAHSMAMTGAQTLPELAAAFNATKADKSLTPGECDLLLGLKDRRKAALSNPKPAFVPANFDSLAASGDIPYPDRDELQEALNMNGGQQ